MDTREAAALLRVSGSHVTYLVRGGHIVGEKRGRSWTLDAASVREYARKRRVSSEEWVSLVVGAKVVRCSPTTLGLAARAGEIVRREGLWRGTPSLELRSVREWAAAREATRAKEAQARAAETRQRIARAQGLPATATSG